MKRVNLELPDELLARVDEVAGDVPRNRWLRRAVEQALLVDALKREAARIGEPFAEPIPPGSSPVPGPNVEERAQLGSKKGPSGTFKPISKRAR